MVMNAIPEFGLMVAVEAFALHRAARPARIKLDREDSLSNYAWIYIVCFEAAT